MEMMPSNREIRLRLDRGHPCPPQIRRNEELERTRMPAVQARIPSPPSYANPPVSPEEARQAGNRSVPGGASAGPGHRRLATDQTIDIVTKIMPAPCSTPQDTEPDHPPMEPGTARARRHPPSAKRVGNIPLRCCNAASPGPRTLPSARIFRLDRHEADRNVRGPGKGGSRLSNAATCLAHRDAEPACRHIEKSQQHPMHREKRGIGTSVRGARFGWTADIPVRSFSSIRQT